MATIKLNIKSGEYKYNFILSNVYFNDEKELTLDVVLPDSPEDGWDTCVAEMKDYTVTVTNETTDTNDNRTIQNTTQNTTQNITQNITHDKITEHDRAIKQLRTVEELIADDSDISGDDSNDSDISDHYSNDRLNHQVNHQVDVATANFLSSAILSSMKR